MRVVISDEESLEPITVVNLPGLTDRCLHERSHWRVAVPPSLLPQGERTEFGKTVDYIDLEFEQISRVTLRHGEQTTWLCLTRATELAMLLTPDWLPGQRPVIERLQDENERLASLMNTVLSSRD
jgi:hypothetical protein